MRFLLVLVGVYTIFHNQIFHCIFIHSNEYNNQFYHTFLQIQLVLGLSNWTLRGQLIQFFLCKIYISGLIRFFFYIVCLIVFKSWLWSCAVIINHFVTDIFCCLYRITIYIYFFLCEVDLICTFITFLMCPYKP